MKSTLIFKNASVRVLKKCLYLRKEPDNSQFVDEEIVWE